MIKAALAIGTAFVIALSPLPTEDEDRKAVERAVLDYVEAFYEMKPELLERSVHEDLTKFGFWRRPGDEEYRGSPMSFDQAVTVAKTWNKDGKAGDDAPKKVEVFDLMDQTAVAKLTAQWGIDYMHLAKFDGEWKILHVLWQSHPE
jgi:hypothetical protein